MIPLIVFYLHIVAMATAFTRRWQEEGVAEGFLAIFLIALIFFVGWSMASFIMKLVMSREGFGVFLDRDAASLLLLTAGELLFAYFYFKENPGNETNADVE